jgi:hypothetical protein
MCYVRCKFSSTTLFALLGAILHVDDGDFGVNLSPATSLPLSRSKWGESLIVDILKSRIMCYPKGFCTLKRRTKKPVHGVIAAQQNVLLLSFATYAFYCLEVYQPFMHEVAFPN